jgi:hypothetical protein
VRRMRAQPQSRVREPLSEGGTAHVRYLWQFSHARATCKHTESEASAFDELCAVLVRVQSANGSQDGRRGGLAEPGPLHQELGVRSRGQECDGLVAPEGVCRQGIDAVACPCGALDLGEASGGLETHAGLSQVIEAGAGLRTPLPAARAGWPLGSAACAAVAQDRGGGGMGWQAAHSGWWRQVFHEGIACRKRQVEGGAQWVPQLAAPFLEGHVPRQQAGGRREVRITGNRQKALALAQEGEETGGSFFSGFTGPVLQRFAIVPHRWAVHQADRIVTACAPFGRGPARRARTVPWRSGDAASRC